MLACHFDDWSIILIDRVEDVILRTAFIKKYTIHVLLLCSCTREVYSCTSTSMRSSCYILCLCLLQLPINKFMCKRMNSNAKVINPSAKLTNSIANGPNSIAKMTNSSANMTKIIAKVTNSIVKPCRMTTHNM